MEPFPSWEEADKILCLSRPPVMDCDCVFVCVCDIMFLSTSQIGVENLWLTWCAIQCLYVYKILLIFDGNKFICTTINTYIERQSKGDHTEMHIPGTIKQSMTSLMALVTWTSVDPSKTTKTSASSGTESKLSSNANTLAWPWDKEGWERFRGK